MRSHAVVAWCTSGMIHLITLGVLAWAPATSQMVQIWARTGGIALESAFVADEGRREQSDCSLHTPELAKGQHDPGPEEAIFRYPPRRHCRKCGELPLVPQPLMAPVPVEGGDNAPAFVPAEVRPRDPSPARLAGSPAPNRSVPRSRVPQELLEASTADAGGAAVDRLPRKLQANPAPPYPPDAYARRQEGRVLLEVQVNRRGLVDGISVSQSSGVASLDEAALKTVRGWRFEPARRAGKPVSAVVIVPVRFVIRRGQ